MQTPIPAQTPIEPAEPVEPNEPNEPNEPTPPPDSVSELAPPRPLTRSDLHALESSVRTDLAGLAASFDEKLRYEALLQRSV